MYLARYNDGTWRIVQAAVWFGAIVVEPRDARPSWWAQFHATVDRLIAEPGINVTFRLCVQNRRLGRLLLLSTVHEREDQLVSLLGVVDRLNGVVDGSVELCQDKRRYDDLVRTLPAIRKRVPADPFVFRDCSLFPAFRVFNLIDHLLFLGMERNWDLAWQANVRRYRATAEDLRWARKNLVCIESQQSSFPPRVIDIQRRMVEKVSEADFVMDEFLAFDAGTAQHRLSEVVEQGFAATSDRLGFSGSLLGGASSENVDEPFMTGFHSSLFQPMSAAEVVVAALRARRLRDLLTWQPHLLCVVPVPANAIGDSRIQLELLLEELRKPRSQQTIINAHVNIGTVQGGEVAGVRVGSIGGN